MSTALVSHLSDVSDILLQNQNFVNGRGQLNLSEMLGLLSPRGPSGHAEVLPAFNFSCRTRNSSGSSSSSGGSVPSKLTPGSPQHQLMSLTEVSHRKLDRSISEPVDRNNNTTVPSSPTSAKNVNSSRYKTELCRPFEENGFCKYGDKCQFAHGEAELRSLNRHPKYKTELCRTFHSVGFCPYGPRCHFIHNEDERKLSQINQLKSQQAAQQAQQQQQQQLQVVQQLLAQAQQQQHQMQSVPRSAPQPMHRANPKALNFSLSLPPMVRDTLGSTADSPPSSLRGSPTLSPISMLSEDNLMGSNASSTMSGISMFSTTPPPQSAPPGFNSAPFSFPQSQDVPHAPPTPPAMSPLNVNTASQDAIASLAASMQAASLHPSSDVLLRDFPAARDVFSFMPSPPHSGDEDDAFQQSPPSSAALCSTSSPMDLSRGIRLPIFSQLSTSPDTKAL